MFSAIRRGLGLIKVEEKKGLVHVEGVPADVISRDIASIWSTSKINKNMFTYVGNNSFSMEPFFLPDFLYMINTIISHRQRRSSIRTLSRIRDMLMENTWMANFEKSESKGRLDWSKLKNVKWDPLRHQAEFFKHYDTELDRYMLNGYLVAAAAGSGKTYIALTLAELLNADLVVLVVPKVSIYRVWRDTIESLYVNKPSYWIAAEGKPYKGERVVIFHYERLGHALELVDEMVENRKVVYVNLDESHNLNDEKSQRTQQYMELCGRFKDHPNIERCDVTNASGTPFKAFGKEAVPLLKVIDPLFNAEVEKRFKAIYGANATRALDILKHRIGLVSFKVEKSELNLDKPIMKPFPVKVPNGNEFTMTAIRKVMQAFIEERVKYYKERRKDDELEFKHLIDIHAATLRNGYSDPDLKDYLRRVEYLKRLTDYRNDSATITATNVYEKNQIRPNLSPEDRKVFDDIKSIIKYTPLKIQGEALGRILGGERIRCHQAMVPYVDFREICESTEKKTVVFTSFVPVLEDVRTKLVSDGFKPVVVYGKTNNELASIVGAFEKDIDLNPLVATFQSLSTAVPLVMADTMLLLNSPFRTYILEQAISRIHRIGATTQTTVYQASLDTGNEPNISTRSNDILAWSQAQVEAIMGIKSPFETEATQGVEQFITSSWFEEVVANEGLNEQILFYGAVRQMFEPLGIKIGLEDYAPTPSKPVSKAPAYMDW